jgi:hypothetical protein
MTSTNAERDRDRESFGIRLRVCSVLVALGFEAAFGSKLL